jgi:hypothetical protein
VKSLTYAAKHAVSGKVVVGGAHQDIPHKEFIVDTHHHGTNGNGYSRPEQMAAQHFQMIDEGHLCPLCIPVS